MSDLPLSNLTPEQRRAFQTHLNDLYDDYQDQLAALLSDAKVMVPNSTYDDGEPLANARAMLDEYARQANVIAHDYYRNVRDAWAEATGTELPPYEEAQVSSDRAAWQVFGGYSDTDFNGLKFTDVINGRARSGLTMDDLWARKTDGWGDREWAEFAAEMINEAIRLSTRLTAERDPSRPKYARVPSRKACAFCLMLASRGFAYWDEKSAGGLGNTYHAHCTCSIIPSWGKTQINGYDPDSYRKMYEEAKESAGKAAKGKNGYRHALEILRRKHPRAVSDGVLETSRPWPDDVVRPNEQIWKHIFDGHKAGANVPNKTHFPQEWDDEKIKWAVMETICAPDDISNSSDGMIQHRRKLIESEYIEVYLKKRRKTKGRLGVESAYPMTEHQRRRLGK